MDRDDAAKVAIKSAMSVADDIADGKLSPAALDAMALEECRQLFGKVAGPEDVLWDLQLEVARGVLAAGGIPANELSEWLGVARRRES
jgi:hypothetical protein